MGKPRSIPRVRGGRPGPRAIYVGVYIEHQDCEIARSRCPTGYLVQVGRPVRRFGLRGPEKSIPVDKTVPLLITRQHFRRLPRPRTPPRHGRTGRTPTRPSSHHHPPAFSTAPQAPQHRPRRAPPSLRPSPHPRPKDPAYHALCVVGEAPYPAPSSLQAGRVCGQLPCPRSPSPLLPRPPLK